MAQCKLCGKKGIFLSISSNGLCNNCDPILVLEVTQKARIIQDCMRIIDDSKKMETRLSRCDLLLDHAKQLLKYEIKEIDTFDPSPSELLNEYTPMRDQIVVEGVDNEINKHITKAEISTTIRTKITNAEKALLSIEQGKKLIKDLSKLKSLELKVKSFIHSTKLQSFLDEAQKAEFKGQIKKAIDQYKEALYFLKSDEIDDDLQKNEISKISQKIDELSK